MRRAFDQMQAQPVVRRHAGCQRAHQPQADGFGLDPEEPDDEPAKNRAPVIARPTNDDHDPDQEGEPQRLIGNRRELPIKRCHHGTGNTDHGRAEDEHLKMAAGHILAHRRSGGFIVANGPHHPTPGRTKRHLGQIQHTQQNDRKKTGITKLDRDRSRCCHFKPHAGCPFLKGR